MTFYETIERCKQMFDVANVYAQEAKQRNIEDPMDALVLFTYERISQAPIFQDNPQILKPLEQYIQEKYGVEQEITNGEAQDLHSDTSLDENLELPNRVYQKPELAQSRVTLVK